jgi:lipopolysaccharide export system protein LptA
VQSITQFARRRKLVTGLVSGALVGTVLVVVLAYWWSTRRNENPVAASRPVPKDIQQQLSGYTFTRSDEGRQVFTIHAARTVAFKEGGTTVLEDVYVEVFGKDGNRRDVLRTRRCDYNAQSGDLFSSGTVQIELNAGQAGKGKYPRSVMLETSQLYFRQQGSLVVSDEPVRFRIGPVSGSARGMSYATKEGWLELKSELNAEFILPGTDQLPVRITASRVRYDKEKGEVSLAGPVTVSQENSRAEAAHATILLDARNRVRRAVFEGQVHAAQKSEAAQLSASAGKLIAEFDSESGAVRSAVAEGDIEVESKRAGSVSRLNAQKVEIAFAGKRSQAQNGTASGAVRIAQEAAPGARAAEPPVAPTGRIPESRKELTADTVHFSFQAGGSSLKDATTVGAGKLVLHPSDPKAGERIVTAGKMLMNFDLRNRLESMRGEGGTRITFQPSKDAPPGNVPQESTAERFMTVLDPATQTVKSLDQTGNFQFREGDRQATAESASYQTTSETLVLHGKPQIWDTEMRARAETILIDLRNNTAEGMGKVQSTHFGAANRGEPTSVLADRVVAERQRQTVHYEGHVRAWRGADVVESATLDVFRAERRVSSGTRVLTSHLQPAAILDEPQAKNGKRPTRPVTIRAEHLEYFDQGRKASYRGNVRLQTDNTKLEADQLDAYFSGATLGKDMELERAIADGGVKVTQPGRRATGRHAEYFSADARIVLSGGPPSLYDAEKGFTSGRSLTFYSRDDRLLISGGDDSATISRHRIEQ